MRVKESEHYMRIEPKEMRHKHPECGCRLVRNEDTGAVSLIQCKTHTDAVEVLAVAKKLQHYLDAVANLSGRVKAEAEKLLKQAETILGRV
jgi:hypothetical protein